MAVEDLTPWLNRVKEAANRKDVFAILDEFRKVEWTDEQRASMSKLYIRVLERLGDGANQKDNTAAAAANEEDGPVWYEKM